MINFDFSEVADFDGDPHGRFTHPENPENLHPIADAVVWLMYATGVTHLAEHNLAEAARRVRLVEQYLGPAVTLKKDDGTDVPIFITQGDLRIFLGLRVTGNKENGHKFNHSFVQRLQDALPAASHTAYDIVEMTYAADKEAAKNGEG